MGCEGGVLLKGGVVLRGRGLFGGVGRTDIVATWGQTLCREYRGGDVGNDPDSATHLLKVGLALVYSVKKGRE